MIDRPSPIKKCVIYYPAERAEDEVKRLQNYAVDRVKQERREIIGIVEEQAYYPDTNKGTRQQWIKDQIIKKIKERGI